MESKVKELRVEIDGLAQLTKRLKPITHDEQYSFLKKPHDENSKEIEKAVNSLYLAKAWLGKVLGELLKEFFIEPYKEYSFTVAQSINKQTTYTKLGVELNKKEIDLLKGEWLKNNKNNPYANDGNRKSVKDIESAADVANFYAYRIKLSNAAFRKHDGNVLIYFDGEPRIINNIEFEFSSPKKLTKNEVKDKIKGTSYVLDITGDFLTLKEDIEPTADVNNKIKTGENFNSISEAVNNHWSNKNQIEKVDWLREEIEKITKEVSNWYTHTPVPSREFAIARTNAYNYLCEARFWLGFELQRTKEQGDGK